MRSAALILLATLAAVASADRVVFVPTGKKVPNGVLQFEMLANPGRHRDNIWLAYGLSEIVEIELWAQRIDETHRDLTANLIYNKSLPIVDWFPGFSAGLMDVLDQTRQGRYAFVAVTFRFGNYGQLNQNTPTEMTIALTTKSDGPVQLGFSLPIADQLRMIGEFDGVDVTAGLELVPAEGLHINALFRADEVLIGLQLARRF